MRLVIGLGNPGPEYERTRHNIGFRVVEELARLHGLVFGPVRDGCRVAGDPDSADGLVLLQPLLYMNRSGEALARWARRGDRNISTASEAEPEGESDAAPEGEPVAASGAVAPATADPVIRPLVICDDIALPLGSLRLRGRGSDGGHRGLESIIRVFGGGEFPRLRLGVAGERPPSPEDWADYVLAPFTDEEWPVTEDQIADACEVVACWSVEGREAAASRFNRRGPGPGAAGSGK